MNYAYTAVTKEGKTIHGVAEAINKEAMIANLTKQGVRPLLVKPESKKITIALFKRNRVKLKDLVVFTRQLSTMVSAGVSLSKALVTLQIQTENAYFKKEMETVVKDVEGGMSLATAFEKHPAIFSSIYVNMVRAGEAGGILDEILKKLATQQEKDAAIRSKIKAASTYPMVLIGITVGAFFALTIFVIPKIGTMLREIGGENAKLPLITTVMLGISDFIKSKWYIIFGALAIGLFFFQRWRKTPAGKAKVDAFLLRIPVVKTIVAKVAIARFARIFSSLMAAGVSVLEALEVTGKALGNAIIQEELANAAKAVKNGKQLSEPISQSKYFPPIVAQMLAVGEETGQTETILVKVAEFYEEEVDAVVDGLSSIIEPVMIAVMGGMVGLVAASVIGPISSLSQNIEGTTVIPNFVLTLLHLWL